MKRRSTGVRNTTRPTTISGVISVPENAQPNSDPECEAREFLRERRELLERAGKELRDNPVAAFLATPQVQSAMASGALPERYALMAVELANQVDNARLIVDTALRDRLTEVLEAIVVDHKKAAASFKQRIEQLSSEIVAVPRFRLGRGQLHVEHTLVATRPGALLDYGLALLMAGWPDNGKLCRCALPSCRKFFIAYKQPRSGLIRTKYCSPEHGLAAHKAGNAERLRISRMNRKKAATVAATRRR